MLNLYFIIFSMIYIQLLHSWRRQKKYFLFYHKGKEIFLPFWTRWLGFSILPLIGFLLVLAWSLLLQQSTINSLCDLSRCLLLRRLRWVSSCIPLLFLIFFPHFKKKRVVKLFTDESLLCEVPGFLSYWSCFSIWIINNDSYPWIDLFVSSPLQIYFLI